MWNNWFIMVYCERKVLHNVFFSFGLHSHLVFMCVLNFCYCIWVIVILCYPRTELSESPLSCVIYALNYLSHRYLCVIYALNYPSHRYLCVIYTQNRSPVVPWRLQDDAVFVLTFWLTCRQTRERRGQQLRSGPGPPASVAALYLPFRLSSHPSSSLVPTPPAE